MSKKQYGGQAVLEGVMMRGQKKAAIAVRKSVDNIVIKEKDLNVPGSKLFFVKWPFVRGVIALISSLVLGLQSLTFSANLLAEEEGEEIKPREIVLMMLFAFGFAVLLFVIFPAFIISFVQRYIEYNIVLNMIEGLIKIAAFLGYVIFISRLNDIKRVFMYHGAEHKVIHNYESDKPLSLDNARGFSTLHPRCGTSFIFIVILMSIFFFSFFGRPPLTQRILYHIMLLPLIAGTSYEIIKKAGKKEVNSLVRILSWPGLLVQKLTTREPDDSMLEVALKALLSVLPEEERREIEKKGDINV